MHSRRNYTKSLYQTGVKFFQVLFVLVFTFSLVGMQPVKPVQAAPNPAPQASGDETTFAVITDYGVAGPNLTNTATMVNNWNPDFIVTAGDNNQGMGCDTTCYAGLVGANYGDYLTSGSERFWPVIGNHDTYSGIENYLAYFDYIPTNSNGTKQHYDFVEGPVHFFMMDSESADKPHNKPGFSPNWKPQQPPGRSSCSINPLIQEGRILRVTQQCAGILLNGARIL